MPTGYTECVENGKIVKLKDFMLVAAGAFIGEGWVLGNHPKQIDCSKNEDLNFYNKEILDARRSKENYLKLSDAEKQDVFKNDVNKSLETSVNNLIRILSQQINYNEMLIKILGWSPPKELENLKLFMLEQIRISMSNLNYDIKDHNERVTGYQNLTFSDWEKEYLISFDSNIEYYQRQLDSKYKHIDNQNKFLTLLWNEYDKLP